MTATAVGNHDDCPMCKLVNRRGQAVFASIVNANWTPDEQAILSRLAFDMED